MHRCHVKDLTLLTSTKTLSLSIHWCVERSLFHTRHFVMEHEWDDKKVMVEAEQPLLVANDDRKGGFRALPFIIANGALEKMATIGLSANMSLYLMNKYHMGMSSASNLIYIWSAATNVMPLLGAVIGDSFVGRFYTIGIGSVICLMGMILLWLTSVIPQASPPPCEQSSNSTCSSPTIFQYIFLCVALGLISIGAGGVRACCLAFGANQLEKGEFQQMTPAVKQSYFCWYYASSMLAILIASTCLVYIQDNMGWGIGFAVPAILFLFATVSFFLASPLYVKLKTQTSLVTGFVQVVAASYRNRHLNLSDEGAVYRYKTSSACVLPSTKLRFLNKACMVIGSGKDMSQDVEPTKTLCTVEQVEELKALLRVIPIWSTGMIMSINICQNSFPVIQAASMNRQITSGFSIPAASFGTFSVIAVIVWVILYDRAFLPLASKIMGRHIHVSARTRMAIGIFISFIAMMVTALVEGIRRELAIKEGYLESSQFTMSAMWLVPQYFLNGIAEASNVIAQNEFYFSEFPRSMSSIASILMGIGLFAANLVASLILNVVDSVTKWGGRESWISTDINKGRYDYYYLVLAVLSMANMAYFLVCSKAYGPFKEEQERAKQEGDF